MNHRVRGGARRRLRRALMKLWITQAHRLGVDADHHIFGRIDRKPEARIVEITGREHRAKNSPVTAYAPPKTVLAEPVAVGQRGADDAGDFRAFILRNEILSA